MRRATYWRPLFYLALFATALVATAKEFDETELRALGIVFAVSVACEAASEFFGRRRRRKPGAQVTVELDAREALASMRTELEALKRRRCGDRASPPEAAERASEACPGPYSYTLFVCNGDPVEVETCSPANTDPVVHANAHKDDVIARADELGCA